MLIRGLQNPFVTRSMSFQHEDVERSFYLVFVLSVPCSFFIYLFLFSKWLLEKLMYVRNSFVQFSVRIDMLQHNLLHKHIYPLFLFWFWYSSCFDVKCWFHTFLNRCSHISMGVLVLLDHQDGHVKSFSTGVPSLQVIPYGRRWEIWRLSVSFIPNCLVFPTLPPFFFLESEILRWSIHFIHVIFLHSFPSMFLSGDLSWRCSRASSSSLFCSQILSVDVIQDFGVDLILFPHFTMLSYSGAPINHSPLAIHIRSAEDS